jgi:hypothetical protein
MSEHRHSPEVRDAVDDRPGAGVVALILSQVQAFGGILLKAGWNLLPILLVVGAFQLLVIGGWPDNSVSIAVGMGLVLVGVAFFLQGLEMSVFPLGKSVANDLAGRGSLPLLLGFGFLVGFGAVIAEPALIAVADQAEMLSNGRVDGFVLRVIVATSVGAVTAIGILRTLLGHPLHWYLVPGYLLVVGITWLAPPEIVGLAYDAGGVTTNIVTVPLLAAIGIGLAGSLAGRSVMLHGFGLVALSVMVPMIAVQVYGIVVYGTGSGAGLDVAALPDAQESLVAAAKPAALTLGPRAILIDLLRTVRDVAPVILCVILFQRLVIRRAIPNFPRVAAGLLLAVIGLWAFVEGLKLGLFPLGFSLADALVGLDGWAILYLFAFAIGLATTLAEPALIAVAREAEAAADTRINARIIRWLVALGVATGLLVGVHRIVAGDSIHTYIIAGYMMLTALTLFAPKDIVPLAFDLGGVTTSEVTVPLVTALGIGLAGSIAGRNPLIDGFGLIAFASLFAVAPVLVYATAIALYARWSERRDMREEMD